MTKEKGVMAEITVMEDISLVKVITIKKKHLDQVMLVERNYKIFHDVVTNGKIVGQHGPDGVYLLFRNSTTGALSNIRKRDFVGYYSSKMVLDDEIEDLRKANVLIYERINGIRQIFAD